MGKCSYAWNEWDEEKNELIRKSCQNEAWKGSDEFCILHDPASEKDVGLFKEMIEKQIESEKERHYFNGYCFPENWDFFVGRKLKIAADFWGATFQGTADFWGATFQDTNFKGATFQSTADFWEATFQDANFEGVTFQDANFRGATFQKADFRGATFEKKLEFALDRVERIDLRDAEFLSRSKVTANLKEALYQGAFIENVAFIDCRWPEDYIIYEEKHMNDEKINPSFSELETIYRDLKQNMQNHGDYTTAGEFYYREMECRKRKIKEKGPSFKELKSYGYSILKHLLRKGEKPEKSLVNWLKSCGYSFLKYTCGYGEKPFRVIASAVLIIVVVAFLFQFGGIVIGEYTPEERIIDYDVHFAFPTGNAVNDYLQCLYYSFVTFTTLGYGDIHPIGYSNAFACAEAFTGAFFIALFVVVFARKMMR